MTSLIVLSNGDIQILKVQWDLLIVVNGFKLSLKTYIENQDILIIKRLPVSPYWLVTWCP